MKQGRTDHKLGLRIRVQLFSHPLPPAPSHTVSFLVHLCPTCFGVNEFCMCLSCIIPVVLIAYLAKGPQPLPKRALQRARLSASSLIFHYIIVSLKTFTNYLRLLPCIFVPSIFPSVTCFGSDFGGLEVACWPLVPKFAGSNSAKAVGFFRAKKSSARLTSEGK